MRTTGGDKRCRRAGNMSDSPRAPGSKVLRNRIINTLIVLLVLAGAAAAYYWLVAS